MQTIFSAGEGSTGRARWRKSGVRRWVLLAGGVCVGSWVAGYAWGVLFGR